MSQSSRSGECNQCGECCTYIKLPLAGELTPDQKRWVELHQGVKVEGKYVRLGIPCSALINGSYCALYGQRGRPQFCRDYPQIPQLDEGCSYKFEAEEVIAVRR